MMGVLTLSAQSSVYDFTVKDYAGQDVSLAEYKGKVLLIVNTATRCGFTPQYKELEALYEKYAKDGLEILDFPCNQFGQQAPGTIQEIPDFGDASPCSRTRLLVYFLSRMALMLKSGLIL